MCRTEEPPRLPGEGLVVKGLADLRAGVESAEHRLYELLRAD
jgi:hypothetical protein